MSNFVMEVEGKKTIDFDLLREKFGEELASEIELDLDFATENEIDWDLEVEEENSVFTLVYFTAPHSIDVYRVFRKLKKIHDKKCIGLIECKELIKKMEALDQE